VTEIRKRRAERRRAIRKSKANLAPVITGCMLLKDEVAKLRLQFLYIPLLLLAPAIACLLTGTFAGAKHEVNA